MKQLLTLILSVALLSCASDAPKDYVTLKGEVSNAKNDTLTIMGKNFKKEIVVNEDGSFQDTLKVTDGFHGFNDGV